MSINGYDPYSNLPTELKLFDAVALNKVEELSAALSEEEVLDFFAINEQQLVDSPTDAAIFRAAFKRGRSIAKFNAATHLFNAMKVSDKASAPAAAIAYLKQFGQLWPTVEEVGTGKNFSFHVVLGD
jgi:hypothetical protein